MENPESVSRESKTKKRRKTLNDDQTQSISNNMKWRTEAEQQIYSSKLFEALRQVRRNNSPAEANHRPRGRVVREAADRVLAVAAKGRTRWSRAILTSRLRLRFKKVRKQKVTGGGRLRKVEVRKENKGITVLQRKVRVLGRLVPGCRKLSFPNLLEETTDYIAALEMQVRAMTALTQLLTGGAGGLAAPVDQLQSNLTSPT
ncbi:hypothetical protein L1049_020121 [Liquidambar formosana]|uniref:BHLH domain-containing protein n=1 Tax=Liquidambar formosana TaxID=63359 RepID=A0AAP0X759_LIQFO